MSEKKSIEQIIADIRANNSNLHLDSGGRSFEHLSDESVLRLYEGIRLQAQADKALGKRYRLLGAAAKQRLDRLRQELEHRGVKFIPIDWPSAED